jgi:pimeloyl-ACP methyl ester carboxylesterase
MPHVEVRGRQLHVERRGDGPPLLLIMGMGGNLRHWGAAFLDPLVRSFDVIAFDNRGMGRSARVDPGEPFTIGDLAGDAAGLLDALGLERAHVLGISMGGMIAQHLAVEHPDRVDRLVIGCSYAGGPGAQLTAPEVFGPLAEAMRSGDRERALRASFEVNVSRAWAQDPAHFEAFKATALEDPADQRVVMLQAQAAVGHDVQDRLGDVTAPTLVLHGTEDRMLVVANGRLIARRIPGARLEELEGVGHMFWVERPEDAARLVTEHLGG